MMLFGQHLPVLYPALISRFGTPVPSQQQGMVGWLCGHTPLFFGAERRLYRKLEGASVLAPHADR